MNNEDNLFKYNSIYGDITFKKVSSFDNFNIWGGILAEDTKLLINGTKIIFKKGTDLEIPDGDILCGILKEDTEIILNNFPYTFAADSKLIFRTGTNEKYIQSGKLVKAVNIVIQNNNYITSELDFYSTGVIKSLQLQIDTLVILNNNPIALKKGSSVCFHKSGNIEKVTPLTNIEIKSNDTKIGLKSGEPMFFYENGILKRGKLLEDIELNVNCLTKTVASNHIIEFDENGKLVKCTFK